MSFDVSVTLRRGERRIDMAFTSDAGLTALFGASGVGKTSLLHAIAGLLSPESGHIAVGGRTLFDSGKGVNLPPEARRCGYVFQDMRLFPHLRVRDNLAFGKGERFDQDEIVRLLEIGPLLGRWPRSLSGGEGRRVAIARALLADAAFLLLDEPLVSLDRARAEEIMQLIERIRDELALPILHVTHDRAEAERLAGRIVELER